MVDIIQREQWGARYEDGGGNAAVPYDDIVLHHSVTLAPNLLAPFDDDYEAVRKLDLIGETRFGRGISYTWAGTPVGLVFEGHSVHRLGAHTGGHNTRKRAFCMVGDYSTNPPTAALINAVAQVVKQEHAAGRCKSQTIKHGHRDLRQTGCPGNAGYAAIGHINAIILGKAPAATPHIPVPVQQSKPLDLLPDFPLPGGHVFGPWTGPAWQVSGFTVRRGRIVGRNGHPGLRQWQVAMQKRGWKIEADGLYGEQVRDVAAKFQKEKGLAVDGLVGIATWTATDRSPVT